MATPPWRTSSSCAARAAARHKLALEFRQSNHEGELIDWIHEAGASAGGRRRAQCRRLYPYLGRDPRRGRGGAVPVIEVHISNIFARERFRHRLAYRAGREGELCGFGIDGYALAIDGLAALRRAPAEE